MNERGEKSENLNRKKCESKQKRNKRDSEVK